MVELREITNQLDFPEGPIALDDGSVWRGSRSIRASTTCGPIPVSSTL